MSRLLEVEIENKSYIKLLDLEQQHSNKIKLTTLEDNQTAVIIKIFFNKSGEHILIKEFNIRNLKPKVSGIPRFELEGSYSNKILNLVLKVDGKIYETSEIKMGSYFRNKLLPLYIIFALILVILLFTGGRWLLSSFIFTKAPDHKRIIRVENTVSETKKQTEIAFEKTNQYDIKIETDSVNAEDISKADNTSTNAARETEASLYTAYFTPNNTKIQVDAGKILKDLAAELKNIENITVEISGYCAMTGTEEGRERLSKERAYNVLNYLKNEGWVPETEPVIKWYGGLRPVTSIEEEIFKNRRVEISIVSQ